MVSGIAIKCTNRISSYSSLQDYKMYNMVSCRTIQCTNWVFILHWRIMKGRNTVRSYSSPQNYKMHEYGKLYNHEAYEQVKTLFFNGKSRFPIRLFFFRYETRTFYDIFVFLIYVTCPNPSSFLDYLS